MPAQVMNGSLLTREDAIARLYRVAFSIGPRARSDTSAGLLDRPWKVEYTPVDGNVWLQKANDANDAWEPPELLFNVPHEVQEIDLGFDTNGNVVVCYQAATGLDGKPQIWFYWYDPRVPGYLTQVLTDGRTPRVLLDDPEAPDVADLLLFYLNDDNQRVEIRTQRELYENIQFVPVDNWVDAETGLPFLQSTTVNLYLEDIAKATDNRLQVLASYRNPVTGRYQLVVAETAPYDARPLDSYMIEQDELQSADVITYVYAFDYVDVYLISDSFPAIDLVDLIVEMEQGPESFQMLHSPLLSSDVIDLVITSDQRNAGEANFQMLHQSLFGSQVTTYILVSDFTAFPESFQMLHQPILGINLQAA